MDNTIEAEKLQEEVKKFQDAFNDDHWSKKYDISKDDLKAKVNSGISSAIIESGIRHNIFRANG